MNFMIYNTEHGMTIYNPEHKPRYVVYRLRFFGIWSTYLKSFHTQKKALEYVLKQSKNNIVHVEYRL